MTVGGLKRNATTQSKVWTHVRVTSEHLFQRATSVHMRVGDHPSSFSDGLIALDRDPYESLLERSLSLWNMSKQLRINEGYVPVENLPTPRADDRHQLDPPP